MSEHPRKSLALCRLIGSNPIIATSTTCRLFGQVDFRRVDFRREMRPIAFVDPGAFELSRWRDGRCGMGHPQALLAV